MLAIGLGPREKVDNDRLRKAMAASVRFCHKRGYASIVVPEPLLASLPGGRTRLLEEVVYAALLALPRSSSLKKPDPEEPAEPLWLAVAYDPTDMPDDSQAAARRGEHAARAVSLARDLAAMPPNSLSPSLLAERAQELAQETGFSCTVLDEVHCAGVRSRRP